MIFITLSGTILLVAGVHGGGQVRHVIVFVFRQEIIPHVQVQSKVFKTVYFIIEGNITDGAFGLVLLVGKFQVGDGV